jgi:hypothetical protein
VPAIADVRSPDGESLLIRRVDHDFFGGNINESMFRYLEYSRLALCDITSLNPNVFYELGVRHRARSSGTMIFRHVDTTIPFDISHIKTFAYDPHKPEQSRTLIMHVVTESLLQTGIDSPAHPGLSAET